MIGALPLVAALLDAARASCAELRKQIEGPRYWNGALLHFKFKGVAYTVPEPEDVMPVGSGEAGKAWCLRQVLEGTATPLKTEEPAR